MREKDLLRRGEGMGAIDRVWYNASERDGLRVNVANGWTQWTLYFFTLKYRWICMRLSNRYECFFIRDRAQLDIARMSS